MYIGNSPANVGNYEVLDDITPSFNGVLLSFPLTSLGKVINPAKSGQLLVSINGVLQEPDDTGVDGFKVSGSNIVFSSAPATGATFWCVYQGQNVDIGTPSFGTVDTVHMVDGSVTGDKLSAVFSNNLTSSPYMAYGGTADAVTLTSVNKVANTSYITGAMYRFRATATNTGIMTINVDGLGVKTVKTVTGVDTPAGYIRTDIDTVISYDGVNFIANREIERGSNVNGSFVKFANGAASCNGFILMTGLPLTLAHGSGYYRNPTVNGQIPLPITMAGAVTDYSSSVELGGTAFIPFADVLGIAQVEHETSALILVSVISAISQTISLPISWSVTGRWH